MRTFCLLAVLGIFSLFALSCSEDSPMQAPQSPAVNSNQTTVQTSDARSPFQQAIIQAIAEREAAGLPVPADVSFQYATSAPTQKAGSTSGARAVEQITVVAKTVIHFTHPNQAGRERWPDFIVRGEVPPELDGFIVEGDYNQLLMDKMEEENPTIWQD